MDLEEEGRVLGAVATDAEDGDDGVCVVVVGGGGCLYLPWPSNSPSSEPSSTDKTNCSTLQQGSFLL